MNPELAQRMTAWLDLPRQANSDTQLARAGLLDTRVSVVLGLLEAVADGATDATLIRVLTELKDEGRFGVDYPTEVTS